MSTFLRVLLTIAGQLPLPLLHGVGWLAGQLLWMLPGSLKRVTLRHLELCLPDLSPEARRRLARRSLIESMKAVAEAPAIWFGSRRRLRRWCADLDASRELRAAIASPRGVMVLTPHLGAWELVGQFAAAVGPITILYKPQKGAIDAVIRAGRARLSGADPVPTSPSGVRALLAALKRGETVGILPDHDPPEGSGRFAPFFGIPAHTMDLVGKLAARSDAAAFFVVARRRSWGRGFDIEVTRAPAELADPDGGAAALNRGVEACVMRCPEQYWWGYKRYRRRPPGAADPYQNLR